MEFIQRKTGDSAVEYFLPKAAESGISLVWDRYERQLPECGFCETGLSCRDCLQGPCISHPFKDSAKSGVCGKDRDTLAMQSLLRLVIKGTMTYLDRLFDFGKEMESARIKPKNGSKTTKIVREIKSLFENGVEEVRKQLPKTLIQNWEKAGIAPQGVARDVFKASQKLEGGITDVEELLLWAFKCSLLGYMAQRLHGTLKRAAFGEPGPTKIEVNLGILKRAAPNLLLYGSLSPILKMRLAEAAAKRGVFLAGVCTDPLVPPHTFPPVTNYLSQEIPIMTGAVDLIVAADGFVNPSLLAVAQKYEVPLLQADGLKKGKDLKHLASQMIDQVQRSFDFRRNIPRDIPDAKECALVGFSPRSLDTKKILDAVTKGKIKGIAILSGSNNVKYTQDHEIITLTQEFLKNDILCFSRGEASVTLAKYGLLNPNAQRKDTGKGLSDLLSSFQTEIPSVIDLGGGDENGATDFLLDLANVGQKNLKDYPVVACFPEANRSSEVVEAMWMVAMGVDTYFWPCLPLTGSEKALRALTQFSQDKFGSALHLITEKKLEPRAKASLIMKNLASGKRPHISGHPWK